MRGSRKFCQRGNNLDNVLCVFFCFVFLFFYEGRKDPITTISVASTAHPTLNAELVAL